MKKVILAATILLFTSGAVSAQSYGKGNQKGTNKNCSGYVDNNKDGTCDKFGTGNYNCKKGQGRAQGKMGAGRRQGTNGQGMQNGGRRGNGGMQGKS